MKRSKQLSIEDVDELEVMLEWGGDQEEAILGQYWSLELENLDKLGLNADRYFWNDGALLLCISGIESAPDSDSLTIAKIVLKQLAVYLSMFEQCHFNTWQPHSVIIPAQTKPYIWFINFMSDHGGEATYAFSSSFLGGFQLYQKDWRVRDLTDVEWIASAVIDSLERVEHKSQALRRTLSHVNGGGVVAVRLLAELRSQVVSHGSDMDNYDHCLELLDSVMGFCCNE